MSSILDYILFNKLITHLVGIRIFQYNFEVETKLFKFTVLDLDDQHSLTVANTNEPLVGVI